MASDNHQLGRIAVSFIVDEDPTFAYTGWHLAHSIARHAKLSWNDIHVQFTAEVPHHTVAEFQKLGCSTHRLERFGDGKYCNKLAQWTNLRGVAADHFLFLDTDMICVADFRSFLRSSVIAGKVVDLENPSLSLLDELFGRAGFTDRPPVISVEASEGRTYRGNCNGGFYSVPAVLAEELFATWREHASAILGDIEPLRAAGKENHVDQISFCMALHRTGLPFADLPSNANYFVHFAARHRLRDRAAPIAMLHYHNMSINVLGLLEPAGAIEDDEIAAVRDANAQIRANFHGRFFWEMRYRHFPERGSGMGSRGDNLEYKRNLLRGEGVETASSVLDVGCGDLEVVSALDLRNYTGIDQSPVALARAAEKRPDWTFLLAPARDVPPAEVVLCFEVAIHQETAEEYCALIRFLAEKTERTLIVSGYDALTSEINSNHMLFYHEPLSRTLEGTGRFRSIRQIGSHSDVVVFRCDV